MKKILFLLLILVPLMAISQTVPADATALENIQITNNTTSLTATKVNVQDANGVINTIPKSDLVNVIEVNDVPSLPLIGEVGKIYVVKNVNKIYRWNGTFYQELSGSDLNYQSIIDALTFTPENVVNKVTDISTGANNITYPTSLAVKTYADNLVVGMINDRGTWNASANAFPTTGGSGTAGAIRKGDMWYVSVGGTLGGKSVNVGDSFRALVNSPAQVAANWSVLEANIGYVPANDASVVHLTGAETITGAKTFSAPVRINNGTVSNPSITFHDESASDTGFNHTTTDGKIDVISNGAVSASFFNTGFTSFQPVTGVSFIKSGATASDALLAGGSTLSNPISGTGTSGFISKWTGSGTQGNSLIQESSGNFTATNPTSQFFRIRETTTGNSNTAMFYVDGTYVKFVADYVTSPIPMAFRVGDIDRLIINTTGNATFSDSVTATSFNGSATLTGIPTAPTATVGTNTTQIATTAFVQANSRPYKVYTALLTQTGTSAPVATVLENTLGGTLVWSRTNAGQYLGTLTGAFTGDKTASFFQSGSSNAESTYTYDSYKDSNNSVRLYAFSNGLHADQIIAGQIEIRVYN